jgi:hypothetical protein
VEPVDRRRRIGQRVAADGIHSRGYVRETIVPGRGVCARQDGTVWPDAAIGFERREPHELLVGLGWFNGGVASGPGAGAVRSLLEQSQIASARATHHLDLESRRRLREPALPACRTGLVHALAEQKQPATTSLRRLLSIEDERVFSTFATKRRFDDLVAHARLRLGE